MKKKYLILSMIIIIVLCICLTPIFFQNDTFYTIKIGELILNNGIDMQDHFSFHNLPYTYPHWLYDTLVYLIYSISSFTSLYIFNIEENSINLDKASKFGYVFSKGRRQKIKEYKENTVKTRHESPTKMMDHRFGE